MKLGATALLAVAACGGGAPATTQAPAKPEPPARREVAVDRGGFTLHVIVVGDPSTGEPPLVALPGGPGLSADYLAPLATLATSTRAVVLVDPRGTGKSTMPPAEAWTLDDYNADLLAVLEQLKAPRAHVVGHSYSGLYAIAFAGAYPDRVASLVMLDVIPPTAAELAPFYGGFLSRLAELQKAGVVPEKIPEPANGDCIEMIRAVAPVWYADPKHPAARALGDTTCREVAPKTPALATYDVTTAAGAFAGPVLAVIPERTPFGDMGTKFLAAMPRATSRVERIAACGHMPLDECPEPTLAAIARFVAPPLTR